MGSISRIAVEAFSGRMALRIVPGTEGTAVLLLRAYGHVARLTV